MFRWTVLISLALGALRAQTAQVDTKPLPYTVSPSALQARGFSFGRIPRRMCPISGTDGPCEIEAFVGPEKETDPDRFTCRKLDRATYAGRCIDGKLEGLSLVLADGSAKAAAARFLAWFDKGRVAFPALTAYRDGKLIGVREERSVYGCVSFGQWDHSTRDSCPKFIEIWGREIFTESTLQSLKDGTFDLNRYGPGFVKYVSGQ